MIDSLNVWAVTGPIGAGKSAASQILERHGAAVVDGDSLGHQLLERRDIKAAIAARFGATFVPRGVVDRQSLGALVFGDPVALAGLNEIMHPPLVDLANAELKTIAQAGHHKLAVFEAAVYFRLPTPPPVDLVVVITAPEEVRSHRLVQRGLSLAEAKRRIVAQADFQERWQSAACVVNNDGSLKDLENQLVSLMIQKKLGSESAS